MKLPDDVAAFLDGMKVPGVLSTLSPKFGPVTSAVWFAVIDGDVVISTPATRPKARNARADARVLVHRGYEGAAVQGRGHRGPCGSLRGHRAGHHASDCRALSGDPDPALMEVANRHRRSCRAPNSGEPCATLEPGRPMTIRVLLFDLGDTLFKLHPLPDVAEEAGSELTRLLGLSPAQAETVTAAALKSYREMAMEGWRRGETGEPPLDRVLAGHFMPHVELSPSQCESLAGVLWRADTSRFECSASRADQLDAFRGGAFDWQRSRTPPLRRRCSIKYLASVGLLPLFESVTYSSKVGVRKPHVEIYRDALRLMDCAPEDAFFVGDRVREDVLGPRTAGIRAALTHEFRQEDPANSAPAAVLTSLDELLPVVAELNRSSGE